MVDLKRMYGAWIARTLGATFAVLLALVLAPRAYAEVPPVSATVANVTAASARLPVDAKPETEPHKTSEIVAPKSSATQTRPPVVYIGLYLHDITKLALQDGTVDVDAEVWAKWRGDFDPERVVLANGGRVVRTKVREESDGDWHAVTWRVRGPLRGEFPLSEFPFDRQKISIEFTLPTSDGILEPDLAASTIEDQFSITGWMYDAHFVPRVSAKHYASDLGHVRDEGRATEVREVAFDVALSRPVGTAATKLFVPWIVLLLLAFGGFWLAEEALTPRVILLGFAVLGALGYPLTVASALPAVHETTIADRVVVVAYVLVGVSVVLHLTIAHFVRYDRLSVSRQIGRWARVALCVGALLSVVVLLRPILLRSEGVRVTTAPPPSEAPFPTSRTTLRVGTTLPLATILASPAALWAFRSLTPAAHDGPEPLYVDELPSVRTGALRLAAGGGLDVTWRLREGARWSDGEPLTVDDILFRAELYPHADDARIEAISPREVVVHYKERVAEALEPPEVLPKHAFKKLVDDLGPTAADAHLSETDLRASREKLRAAIVAFSEREPTPGLGPYRIVSFAARESAVLEINPFWPGKKPAISRIELTRFASSRELRSAFETGKIDLTTANALSPADADALFVSHPEAVTIRSSARIFELFVDRKQPLFATAEGRHAVSSALDRARIVTRIYARGGAVAAAPVLGTAAPEPVYNSTILRAYLAAHPEAALPFPVYCDADAETDCVILGLVVEDLNTAGAKATLRPVKRASELRLTPHGGILGLPMNAERASVLIHFDLPVIGGLYNTNARHSGFDNETAALWERYQRALYPERREQFRERMFARHSELLPTIPLVFPNQRVIAAKELHGWGGPPEHFGHLPEDYFFE